MSIATALALGFVLGIRHATDADHVVAISTIVSRTQSLRTAAPIGILWGIGHTITIIVVGGAIILCGVVISPHVGLAMELCVALMLVVLGCVNVRNALREDAGTAGALSDAANPHRHQHLARVSWSLRPLVVGVIHGLAGSAAITLLVLGTIRNAAWAACYLFVFGVGTLAGMLLITTVMALSIAAAARVFDRLHRLLGLCTGLAGVIFGAFLCYEVGFVDGLFSVEPNWMPR